MRRQQVFLRDFGQFGNTLQPKARSGLADEEQKDRKDPLSPVASAYQKAAPILDAVWQMVGATLVGTLAGWWLDKRLHSEPWLLIAGAVLGVGTGMYAFIRAALRNSRPRGPSQKGPDSQA